MYLGKLSILGLRIYINGYISALYKYDIKEDDNIFDEHGFNDFVAKYYKKPAEAGWALNIWADNYGDEPQSFSYFFRLFDKFIKREKERDFYNDLMHLYRGQIKQNDFNYDNYKTKK